MISRRQFFKLSAATGVGLAVSGTSIGTRSVHLGGLRCSRRSTDGWTERSGAPAQIQESAPNALDPGFKFYSKNGKYKITMQQTVQMTGLVGPDGVHSRADDRVGLWRERKECHLARPHLRGAVRSAHRGYVAEQAAGAADRRCCRTCCPWIPRCTGPTACRAMTQYSIDKMACPSSRTCMAVTPTASSTATLNTFSAPAGVSAVRAGSTKSTSI